MSRYWKTILVGFVLAGGLSGTAVADGYEPVGKGFAPPVSALKYSALIEGWSAYVDLGIKRNYPFGFIRNEDIDDSYFASGGSARVSVPLSNSVSTQWDLDAEAFFTDQNECGRFGPDCSGGENHTGSYVAATHLSWRNPASYLVGLFGGYGRSHVMDDGEDADLWFIGGEGQVYWNNLTLYGQAGYFDSEDNSGFNRAQESFSEAWFLRGVARYFLSERTMISGEIAYASGEADELVLDCCNPRLVFGPSDADILNWGVRVDHQFLQIPASVFAAYEGGRYEQDRLNIPRGLVPASDMDEAIFKVGMRYQFYQDTLKSNDRTGATLDLPHFGRWGGYYQENLDPPLID